ncbi:MAG: oligosaccharide flippase family protein [Thermoplasmata archaeon]|nr:oligosaccharide flippase family protein [Thermoplasmata archaeon]
MAEVATSPPRAQPTPATPRVPGVGISSTGVFAISITIQLIGYVSTYFLVHHVPGGNSGLALLGTVQLYLIIASSINGIGDLRIGSAFVYFVSRGKPARDTTSTYFVLRLTMVALAGTSLWVLGPLLNYTSNTEEIEIFAVFMVLPILWSISTVYTQVMVAEGDSVRGQYPLLVESIVRTSLLVLVAFLAPTIWAMTLAYLVGAIASIAISLPLVSRLLGPFRRAEAVNMFRFAWPLMGSLFLMYVATNAIPFFVNASLGSEHLFVFTAANGFRILVLQLPVAITTPLFPHLASLHARREYEEVRARTWKALRYTAMIVVPTVLALVVYRTNVLNLLYTTPVANQGAISLAILAASAIPLALSQIIGNSLNSIGKQRLELYLTSGQVVALFGSALLLLPPISLFHLPGLTAAAVAVLFSSIVALVFNTYFMERMLGVRIQPMPILTILLSAAASFLAVSRLNAISRVNAVIPVSRWYVLIPAILLGFAVYVLVLALTGELSKEDVKVITASLGLPERMGLAFGRICWRDHAPAVNGVADMHPAGLLGPVSGGEANLGPPLLVGGLSETISEDEVGGRIPPGE